MANEHQEQLYTASGMYWGKTQMTNTSVVLKKAKKITIITHMEENLGQEWD